jgi:tetratricopeptide (TPR) repeat protein
MSRTGAAFAALLACTTVGSWARAQGPETSPKAPAPATKKDKAAPAPAKPAEGGEVRRDPNGVKGISPFWENVNKGDAAYIARDFDAAIGAYRDAIAASPQNPLGHYRLGEAQLAKGNIAEAEQSWDTGLRFAGDDQRIRAKLLFLMADLRERQKAYDEATARWEQYEKVAQQQPEAKAFPATAAERKKRIADWKRITEESAAVKERIEARLKEAEAAARKNAK